MKFLIGLTLVFGISVQAGPRTVCNRLLGLTTQHPNRNPTEILIAYFTTLINERVIDETGLVRLQTALGKSEIITPLSQERANTDSATMIHREEIDRQIQNNSIDKSQLAKWIDNLLIEKRKSQVARTETQTKTEPIYKKMEFHIVPPPSDRSTRSKYDFRHVFEVMSTPVTQKQWVDIMGENPSTFFDGENSAIIKVRGKSVELQPDNPVENVTWWSAIEFANRLSAREGLKPAYDLAKVTFYDSTRAENGTLANDRDMTAFGQFYDTEGYRLPSIAEMDYLFEVTRAKEDPTYEWYLSNSNSTTHPVGQLRARMLGSLPFYDLLGNVSIWTQDGYIQGGSWRDQSLPSNNNSVLSWIGNSNIGIRLVRTLK